ncbi:MAG: VOC family protein [Actinomycetales bacterium]
MASQTSNFCIDAGDPYAQTLWWKEVLEDFRMTDEDQHPGDEECGLEGPDGRYLLFLKVPEAKSVKNRMHMCLRPTDRTRDEEIDRLLALGATIVNDLRKPDRRSADHADHEGTRFSILTPRTVLPAELQ